jgi:ABC-type transporter Mla subunit MlaD
MFTSDPIDLLNGALTVTGDGRGIEVNADWKPDQALDWSQPAARKSIKGAPDTAPQSAKKQLIKPGGPVFQLDTTHSPFLHARADVSLFGCLSASVQMDATDTGFSFDLHLGAGSVAGLDLSCHLQTKGGFEFRASGDFHVDINVDTDPIIPGLDFTAIHLHTGFNGHMDMKVNANTYELNIGGGFYFEGMHLSLPTLTLTVPIGKLADIATHIAQHIKDKALEIFGDIWDGLQKAYKAVKEAALAVYNEGKKVVSAIADTAKEGVKLAGQALSLAGEELNKITGSIVANTAQIAAAAVEKGKQIAAAAAHAASELYDEGKKAISNAVHFAADLGRRLADDVAQIGHDIADAAHKAVEYVSRALADAEQFATSVIDGARHAAESLVHTAQAIADGIANAARDAWNEAKKIGGDIAHFFSNVGHAVAHAATSVVHFFASLF